MPPPKSNFLISVVMASQDHPPPQPEEREWKLAGGTMRVLGHGKKKPTDMYMVLQLEFSFDHDRRPRRVGMFFT